MDDTGGKTVPATEPRGSASARTDPSPALERGATLGRYIVVERVGAGGMGVVYSAYDPALDRKVALKLLVGEAGKTRARLLREGQALARLAHPNVVAVHDVGELDGRVFIAMEFVDGQTLRAWLKDRPRPAGEVLDAFRQAGRALAAGHALGIIHRDFKPENALIDAAGRVRVVDFGLARAADEDDGGTPSDAPSAPDWERSPSFPTHAAMAVNLTRTGAVMGTPAYMAPEQHGGRADARADQYSFAVAFHEALTGERPGSATPGRDAPRWLRAILGRALRPDPGDRWPSMEELLAALQRDPAERRRRWLAIGGAATLVALGVGGLVWQRGRDPAICGGAAGQLAGVWDDGRRREVRAAFAATDRPFAADAFARADAALTAQTGRWAEMYRGACEATRVRREQSEQVLDLRMECLAQRRAEVGALADALAHADARAVEKAPQAVASLGAIGDCADLALLRSPVPMPAAPEARARATAQRARLAQARALELLARFPQAFGLAVPAALDAVALRYRPLEAEAFLAVGQLQSDTGDPRSAERSLRTAVNAAEAGRHGAIAAQAGTMLVRIVGYDLGRPEEGHEWAERAGAAVEALGDEPRLRAQLDNNLGVLYYAEERWDESLARHQSALAAREQAYGPDSPFVAASLSNIGLVRYAQGRLDEAVGIHRRAVAIAERAYGPRHPKVAELTENLAAALLDQGKYEEALAVYERSRAVKEAAFGPDAPALAITFNNLGNVYYGMKRYDEALEAHRRALAIKEKTFGPEHRAVASSLTNIANVLFSLGRYPEARALHERALGMKEKLLGAEHSDVAHSVVGLAEIARAEARYDDAIALYRRAIAIWEKAVGPAYPLVAAPLTGLGQALFAKGRPAEARAPLERALAIREAQAVDASQLATTRFALARALWPEDRDRARQLAARAEEGFAAAKNPDATEVAAWRKAHP
jgi:tetratricopeptide (TPR) repeat protein/predicted Ser/Thr protein kinase